MIITKIAIEKSSAKTKRQIRYEYELEHTAIRECVFKANSTREFKKLIETVILEDPRMAQLALHRQIAVDAYVRGALDALAYREGMEMMQPPQSVMPKPRDTGRPSKRPSARAKLSSIGPAGQSFPNVWEDIPAAARVPKDLLT